MQEMTPQVRTSVTAPAGTGRPDVTRVTGITAGQDGHPRRWLMLPVILIAMFMVNVPVGVLAVIAAVIVVPPANGQRRPRLDPLGAVGVSGSLALALVPLTLGRDEGWPVWT